MILSEDQFLFYKERTYPNLHNPFGWNFAISSNNTKKDEIYLGRVTGNLETLANFIEDTGLKKITLISNPFYRGDFTVDGSHSETYLHQEKGVRKSDVKKFTNFLKRKGIESNYVDVSVSLRHISF